MTNRANGENLRFRPSIDKDCLEALNGTSLQRKEKMTTVLENFIKAKVGDNFTRLASAYYEQAGGPMMTIGWHFKKDSKLNIA